MWKFVRGILLISLLAGCNPFVAQDKQVKSLEKAALTNDVTKVENLLEKKISFHNAKQQQDILKKVISYGYDDVAKVLVTHEDKKEQMNVEELLSVAISSGAVMGEEGSLIKELLSRVKDVNAQNNEGNSSLLFAVENGDLPLVKELEKQGADFSVKNNQGEGVRLKAVMSRNMDMLTYIYKKVGNKEEKTTYGSTPLFEAIKEDRPDMALLLVSKGSDISNQDHYGKTPLIYASELGQAQVVKALLERGADKGVRSKTGERALDYAKKWKNTEVVTLLK